MSRVVSVPFYECRKAPKGLTAFPPETVCNQTAMGLRAVASAVFLIAKSFWSTLGVSEEYVNTSACM
jgi:hypothetical protein